jgi:tetratricopeptide (TPR) repeat protein
MGDAMKSNMFIGSSVEGLSVAYAVQQNLEFNAEVTVWSQGIFHLSNSALDSLIEVLNRTDFGIFVFTPDDIVTMRGEQNKAVRDNVLFELGLFVGRLGKERSFVLLPRGEKDFHLPTDLIGVAPGEYDADRLDKNYQAATGPVCHQIRAVMNKLGSLSNNDYASPQNPQGSGKVIEADSGSASRGEVGETSQSTITDRKQKIEEEKRTWLEAYNNNEYDKAISILEKKVETAEPDKVLNLKMWIGQTMGKKNLAAGLAYLQKLKDENPERYESFMGLAMTYSSAGFLDEAIAILDHGIGVVKERSETLKYMKASYIEDSGDIDTALNLLNQVMRESPKYTPAYTLAAEWLTGQGKKDEAQKVYEAGLKSIPNNQELLFGHGVLLIDQGDNKAALEVFRKLIKLNPKNSDHFGYLGNAYLNLNFYGLSLEAYETANSLTEGKQSWIVSNMGNILGQKGFYPKAIDYLKKAIELEPDSDYSHGRLADYIKSLKEEEKKVEEVILESRQSKRQKIEAVDDSTSPA